TDHKEELTRGIPLAHCGEGRSRRRNGRGLRVVYYHPCVILMNYLHAMFKRRKFLKRSLNAFLVYPFHSRSDDCRRDIVPVMNSQKFYPSQIVELLSPRNQKA